MTETYYCRLCDLDGAAHALRDLRHDIHRRPELGYREHETADLVATRLEAWGYDVTRNVGGTGVVGTLCVGTDKSARTRSIGIRADIDALPITEATGLGYASETRGSMHACGHDGHTTMLLGAAEQLAATRRFAGTVHLIFQPAEEIPLESGATRMIEDGLFERFHCDAIFGLHNHPGAAQGRFLFRPGAFMSAADKATITVHGVGGHAARPHLAVDAVVVAASIVMALQTVVARNIDPDQAAVVSIGSINGGTANNVIAQTATLELSIRSFDANVREKLKERITAIALAQAQSYGARAVVDYAFGHPVVVNDAGHTAFAAQVARELVGEANVEEPAARVMGSEDFAHMLQHRPGCFLRLGNGIGDEVGSGGIMLHNPRYDFNDANLTVGAAFWTRLVERFLDAG
jgi:hippurate hydrolase